ncbi:MAG: hypothetical protein K8F30_10940, partial [Taibaiella sp.]|nr:hypothetical protein [Taibaiella sp.]
EELNGFLQLDKYRAIFFGEQHNAGFDPEIKYHLITDLNKRTGLRHVFLEMGFSSAWNINQYLQTGDTTYLYNPAWPRTHGLYSRLWTRLYEYNRGLPDGRKIVIHGVDFERTDVFRTLKRLSPIGQVVPAPLRPVMDTIDAHLSDPPLVMWKVIDGKFIVYDNSAFTRTFRYIQKQFLAYTDITKTYFGSNYHVVEDIITNDGLVEVRAKRRNSSMFTAMQRIIDEQKIDRFIGFFGGQHTTYTVGNSLANAAADLRGLRQSDILNIAEFAYNINSKDTAFRRKHFHELVALNGSCKATVLPARVVPEYKNEADFVIIADITE